MRDAGSLRGRVLVQKRGPATDELGNPVPGGDVWATQFETGAGFKAKLGGEQVLAGRLQGTQTYVVTIRQSVAARLITPEWRLVDARNEKRVFNIRSLSDPLDNGQWLELLVQDGVAS